VFTLQLKETRTKGNWIKKAHTTQTGKKERMACLKHVKDKNEVTSLQTTAEVRK